MTSRATRISARIPLRCVIVVLAIAIGGVGALAGPPDRADVIDKLMTTLHERGQFNGAILVAEHGDVLYRKGFGKADISTETAFAPDTMSDIGSVTKQFTAMAIMMLAERRRISYDDLVSKYIPEFSGAPHLGTITVRQLLTHTSGIPDYGDLGIDDFGLNQTSLIAALLKRDADISKPGMKYRYSNVGYALLAIIVQNVSGQRFSRFLTQEIFLPCGMTNTFVYDGGLRSAPEWPLATIRSGKSIMGDRPQNLATVASTRRSMTCSGGIKRSIQRSWCAINARRSIHTGQS